MTTYRYRAELSRVVDGDTIDVIIDLGFRMTTEQRIRLKGIDTPEIWRVKHDSEEYRKGMEAKRYVEKRLAQNGNEFEVETDKEPGVYGRYIGVIWLSDRPQSLNDELLETGHAVVYKK